MLNYTINKTLEILNKVYLNILQKLYNMQKIYTLNYNN
jgi:hypothetical protein